MLFELTNPNIHAQFAQTNVQCLPTKVA